MGFVVCAPPGVGTVRSASWGVTHGGRDGVKTERVNGRVRLGNQLTFHTAAANRLV